MGILSWVIVGLIAGWLAGLVMKGKGFGLIGNTVIGIVGGLLGGYLASALFKVANPISGFNLTTIVIAFLGAVILLAVIRLLRKI